MKKMTKVLTTVLVIALAALTLAGCAKKDTSPVTTDGSTSMEKVIGTLGEAFTEKEGINVTYNPTGSGSGIQAVSEGRCDIGLSSRALKDDEKATLTETVVALDGIAMIVNPENPVSDLTVEQIADIYTGKITNWSEVGGNDAEIVLIGREAGSGTRDGFESITGTKDACQYRQEHAPLPRCKKSAQRFRADAADPCVSGGRSRNPPPADPFRGPAGLDAGVTIARSCLPLAT